jgi:pimeloyl-ACP methyl ester carboxylesterase
VIRVAHGRYAGAMLEVPATTLIGARDLVTSGMAPGLVAGQPNLHVEVLGGVGHWIPEQRPDAILEWTACPSHRPLSRADR